jgi:pimeloyl-ACP methyl ester carboxylesterase
VDFSGRPYRTVVAELLRQTLDAFGIDRACLVGGSIGNLWALRLAQADPSRVERMVAKQLAGLGHATGDKPGQVPTSFVDWRVAMTRETDWRRHERDMVR